MQALASPQVVKGGAAAASYDTTTSSKLPHYLVNGGALLSHTVCNQDHDDDSWLHKCAAVKTQAVVAL